MEFAAVLTSPNLEPVPTSRNKYVTHDISLGRVDM